MALEDQRFLHEDLERLEQGVADRIGDEPKHIRDRLMRDYEISDFLTQISTKSSTLLDIYRDDDGRRAQEIQSIGTGDPMEEFYKRLATIKEHHAKYPNEPVENLERAYRPRRGAEADPNQATFVDSNFSGEEALGRFFDLNPYHEMYLNLPNVKRLTYLQYLDIFDNFAAGAGGLKRQEKMSNQYLAYVQQLSDYLKRFMERTRPLENVEKVVAEFDKEFEVAWEKNEVPEWEPETATNASATEQQPSSPDAVWCDACVKEFKNKNVYDGHLSGKKHKRAVAEKEAANNAAESDASAAPARDSKTNNNRMQEYVIAHHEYLVMRLAKAMSTERTDTRVNVERKQGMTERERQQELENLFNSNYGAGSSGNSGGNSHNPDAMDEDDEVDDEGKIYNPLKLPLGWDDKPIPFWLFKLHGLGTTYECEICGNRQYRGRRAFDKHFHEADHTHRLHMLGITHTALFRDITKIKDAQDLWAKIQKDWKRKGGAGAAAAAGGIDDGNVVQMEDAEGNVMPEKVYYDLQKQGII